MIDINTRVARAKLATLPPELRADVKETYRRLAALYALRAEWDAVLGNGDSVRRCKRVARMQARIAEVALNAAIVAAFEPLTVHDHSGDVARILGGDV